MHSGLNEKHSKSALTCRGCHSQVLDACRKYKGSYMRFMLTRLVDMGYQTRLFVKDAGGHGAPQV